MGGDGCPRHQWFPLMEPGSHRFYVLLDEDPQSVRLSHLLEAGGLVNQRRDADLRKSPQSEEQGQIKAGVGPFLDRRQREPQASP